MTLKEETVVKVLKFIVPIVIEPDEEKFYAYSPALSGLMVDGDTREEALQNARDGATALLHSMVKDGDPIPLSIMSKGTVPPVSVKRNQSYSQEEIRVNI